MLLSVESLDFSRQRGSKTYKMLKKTLPQLNTVGRAMIGLGVSPTQLA